jgi:hypothetical protein
MNEADDELTLELGTGEQVVLSRSALKMARHSEPELVDFILGKRDSFPPFDEPVYEGEQGVVEVRPGVLENLGYYGGPAQSRLNEFAHLVRPFAWMDDPRLEALHELVRGALTPDGATLLSGASTQDLWDAVFIYARGERFSDGVIAANAGELTAIANEVRDRLLANRSAG